MKVQAESRSHKKLSCHTALLLPTLGSSFSPPLQPKWFLTQRSISAAATSILSSVQVYVEQKRMSSKQLQQLALKESEEHTHGQGGPAAQRSGTDDVERK